MNGNSTEMEHAVAQLPEDSVFVYLKPIEAMVNKSSILATLNPEEIHFYISVPKKTCSSEHLAKFLAGKFGGGRLEENDTLWTFPFVVYANTEGTKYAPIPKLFTMEMMERSYPCYNPTENCFTIFYSHDRRIDSVAEVTAANGPSTPVATVSFSSSGSSSASNSTNSTEVASLC